MSRRQNIEDLNDIAVPEQPALSPDGQEVVYVLRTSDAAADRNVTALWRVGSRDGEPERLTAGPADAAPAWSPDGLSVAFLRGGDRPAQLWLLPARGGEPRSLTDLPLGAGRPVWSPDGSRIAFAAPGRPARNAGGERRRAGEPRARSTRRRAPRLPGRRRRDAARRPPAPARARSRDRRTADRSRAATGTRGIRPGRRTGSSSPSRL